MNATVAIAEAPAARETEVPWSVAFVLAALVLAWRAPDSLTRPQFWAEDGTIFFAQQHGRLLPQLFSAYAGYLLWIPRLVAWVAAAFSAVHGPTLYNFAALATAAAGIASLRTLRLGGAGYVLLLAPLALTPTNGEAFGTLTNVQWFTQFYLLVVVARFLRDEVTQRPWLSAVATALVGLTGPFSLFAVAAAAAGLAWRRYVERDRVVALRDLVRAPATRGIWILLVCGLVQSWFALHSEDLTGAIGAHIGERAASVVRSTQVHVLGREFVSNALFLTSFAAFALAAALSGPSIGASSSVLFGLLVYALLEWLAPVGKASVNTDRLAELEFGDRYFLLMKTLYWWCIAMVAAAVWRRSASMRYVAVALLLGANAVSMSAHLQRRSLHDLNWYWIARMIDDGIEVTAPINPPGWILHVPARERAR
jgi:hypothetical protein